MKQTQLEKNIAYLIDKLDYNDSQIGLMLRAIEDANVASAEYFYEEFVLDKV